MKIQAYIKDLLITNQGVIIPGLGGFVSEYEPAAFDVSENKFLPPSKKITFKPEYTYYDQLLIDYISEKENVDREESKKQLDDFVIDIKNRLKKGEKIVFVEIGTLSQTSKKEIQFKQDSASNLLADSFGLKSIKTKPIVKPLPENKPGKTLKQKKSYKQFVIISSLSIILICVIALSWTFTNGFKDFSFISFTENTETETTININKLNTQNNLDSIARADSIKALINQSIDENTDKRDALFYREPKKEEPKPQYTKFYIIAGSFKNMKNAEKYSVGLRDKGYNPEIIQSGENLFRISIFCYADEPSALKELYKLREKADIKSVWILKAN